MKNIIDQKSVSDCYQPLFDLMQREHGLILLQSQMDDIISAVSIVNERWEELNKAWCDVDGCKGEVVSQGNVWRNTGYWCVCQFHAAAFRAGEPQPAMNPIAIQRESNRGEDGVMRPGTLSKEFIDELFVLKNKNELP